MECYRSMKTIILTLLAAALCSASHAEVRKWTSAEDALKTFEGELTTVKNDTVTIKMKNGSSVSLALAKLSTGDREYISAQEKEKAAAAATAEATAKLKDSPMAKALDGSTVILNGKKLKKHDVLANKTPQYYLIYWGASWCPPCRQSAPQLASAYDETLSKGKNIEVVHLSCDQDEPGMISFVTGMKFNFPVVPRSKWVNEKIFQPMAPKGIPNYKLVDADGKILAEGEAAKSKAKELATAGAK